MKKKIKNLFIGVLTLFFGFYSCSRQNESLEYSDAESERVVDSIMSTIPNRIYENDTLIIKEFDNGKIDTTYKGTDSKFNNLTKVNSINKKSSLPYAYIPEPGENVSEDQDGNFYSQLEDFTTGTKIARSMSANVSTTRPRMYLTIYLAAWVVNPNNSVITTSGTTTTNVTMYGQSYYNSPVPALIVNCSWSAYLNVRTTYQSVSGSSSTSTKQVSWSRSKTYK